MSVKSALDSELIAAIRLSRLPGVGARKFKELIEKFSTPSAALFYYSKNFQAQQLLLPGFSKKKSPTEEGINRAKDFIADNGKLIYYGHPNYPAILARLSEPPPVLFYRGHLPNLVCVAIVGTRCPTQHGIEIAENVTKTLVALGFGIVSGGAAGIDTIAHWTAVNSGGFTLAVFGTGLDRYYPISNRCLFDTIAEKGCLMSELLPGTPPRRDFFPTRNRIVAGLAVATIVIQAGEKSGALITARFTRRFGRKLIVYCPSESEQGKEWAGNKILIRDYAERFSSIDELHQHILQIAAAKNNMA